MQKTPREPTKTASKPNINIRCFFAMQFLSQFFALFWRTIYRPKNTVAYKKLQISGVLLTYHQYVDINVRQLLISIVDTTFDTEIELHLLYNSISVHVSSNNVQFTLDVFCIANVLLTSCILVKCLFSRVQQ